MEDLVELGERILYKGSYTPGKDDVDLINGIKGQYEKIKQLEAEVLALASNQ